VLAINMLVCIGSATTTPVCCATVPDAPPEAFYIKDMQTGLAPWYLNSAASGTQQKCLVDACSATAIGAKINSRGAYRIAIETTHWDPWPPSDEFRCLTLLRGARPTTLAGLCVTHVNGHAIASKEKAQLDAILNRTQQVLTTAVKFYTAASILACRFLIVHGGQTDKTGTCLAVLCGKHLPGWQATVDDTEHSEQLTVAENECTLLLHHNHNWYSSTT
jgi:hypothetical protein